MVCSHSISGGFLGHSNSQFKAIVQVCSVFMHVCWHICGDSDGNFCPRIAGMRALILREFAGFWARIHFRNLILGPAPAACMGELRVFSPANAGNPACGILGRHAYALLILSSAGANTWLCSLHAPPHLHPHLCNLSQPSLRGVLAQFPTTDPHNFICHTAVLPRARSVLLYRLITGHIPLHHQDPIG
jgi:hypothetical protein